MDAVFAEKKIESSEFFQIGEGGRLNQGKWGGRFFL